MRTFVEVHGHRVEMPEAVEAEVCDPADHECCAACGRLLLGDGCELCGDCAPAIAAERALAALEGAADAILSLPALPRAWARDVAVKLELVRARLAGVAA